MGLPYPGAMTATMNPRLPRPTRLIDAEDITCPAGCPARAGSGVLCRIEGEVIDGRMNPSSLMSFCLGAYKTCPTWIADKDAIAAGRRGALG